LEQIEVRWRLLEIKNQMRIKTKRLSDCWLSFYNKLRINKHGILYFI
jgi:hypothetical protein